MAVHFRLLTESDVKAVLSMDDLIETMASALQRFSSGRVTQPVRTVIPVGGDDAFFATMPAFVRGSNAMTGANFGEASPTRSANPSRLGQGYGEARRSAGGAKAAGERAALGAKLVTLFGANAARGLHTHLASIVLLDPETGALLALLDGRYITEARTAAVSAVSSRLLARKTATSLAILGSGVQARSHLEAIARVHQLRQVTVWSPQKLHREQFVAWARTSTGSDPGPSLVRPQSDPRRTPYSITAVDHAGEAVVGADVIVLVTASPTPVLENGWVKPGAHVISVGACRPTQREMDPALVARARLFVDSRAAALVESGDVALGIQEGRFGADHIVAEIGELVAGAAGRQSDADVTIFKSLGLAVEDVTAADLAYRRAVEHGIGTELTL
ncbi:MAG: ornithine cyclodeaminase family protein [Acidobacteria bacterium]|nr:ornithine cyclodeaminase family protein [Acidobacteriota bacterium]